MKLPVADFWSTAALCGTQAPSRVRPRVECVLVLTWLSSDLLGLSGAIEGKLAPRFFPTVEPDWSIMRSGMTNHRPLGQADQSLEV